MGTRRTEGVVRHAAVYFHKTTYTQLCCERNPQQEHKNVKPSNVKVEVRPITENLAGWLESSKSAEVAVEKCACLFTGRTSFTKANSSKWWAGLWQRTTKTKNRETLPGRRCVSLKVASCLCRWFSSARNGTCKMLRKLTDLSVITAAAARSAFFWSRVL